MTRTKKLRRAVAEAHRAADRAATSAWRARRKMDEVRAAVGDLGTTAPIRAFIVGESTRLMGQAHEVENAAVSHRGDLYALAEFMGAKES